MGSRFRHFSALMKKNWIIWKRSLGMSLCELFCPVVLMAVLAIARAIIQTTYYPEESNIQNAYLMYPVHYLNASNVTASEEAMMSDMQGFLEFSNISMASKNAILNFFPQGCRQFSNENSRPIIAYAGDWNLTQSVIDDLAALCKSQPHNKSLL